jgi:hypothetical protein
MILKNKYIFGLHATFYELEMLDEHIRSLVQMVEDVENKENITFHFTINFQQKYEKIDWAAFFLAYPNALVTKDELVDYYNFGAEFSPTDEDLKLVAIENEFIRLISKLPDNCHIVFNNKHHNNPFYSIADYRRDICWNNSNEYDYVCFSESDSLWPKQTLTLMEGLHNAVADQFPKFIANFAGRKNWDKTWDRIVHPLFEKVQYEDNEDWIFNNEASEKSYMSLEIMNEINDIDLSKVEVHSLSEPKADGSCLIFSSELLNSGVTLPKSIILHSEDEAILRMAKKIMGDEFVQFHFHSILRVHNRRHPKKRMYVLDEDNKNGICSAEKKGQWWVDIEEKSKFNLETLFSQQKSKKL